MMKFINKLILASLLLFSNFTFADQTVSPISILQSDEDFNYSDYYQIKEDPKSQNINILAFDHIMSKFPLPTVPYKRDVHFGGWLRDNTGGSCLNTRGKVLIRDSVSTVTYTSSGCTVARGQWNDPYSANMYSAAKDIQIDHVVALKNAYMTGAFEWDFKKRCLYANYQGNNFHLLSVNGDENLKKSDQSPSGYTPPNKAYTCQFIKEWLNVKLIWSLRVTPKEASAIMQIAEKNNCDPQGFFVSAEDLKAQRDFMSENSNLCSSGTTLLEKF